MSLSSELRRYQERLVDEYQRAQVIDRMDRQHLIDQYQHAQVVELLDRQFAEDRRQGQVIDRVSGGVLALGLGIDAIESHIARLAAVADSALPAIVEQLALAAERLGGIERMLASPSETAADEMYRRGSLALTSGWLEEAVTDLTCAVETYPYHPKSWFNLGLAHERRGASSDAADAMLKCARYSVKGFPSLAATAVLIAGAALRRAGDRDAAAEALTQFLPELDRCAEIHLSMAVHHHDLGHLIRALELKPALAADARAAGSVQARDAALRVCDAENGSVDRLRRLELALHDLVAAAARTDDEFNRSVMKPSELPEDGVDRLLTAEAAILVTIDRARAICARVSSLIQQIQLKIDEGQAIIRAAERRLDLTLSQSERCLDQWLSQSTQQEADIIRRVSDMEHAFFLARQELLAIEIRRMHSRNLAELHADLAALNPSVFQSGDPHLMPHQIQASMMVLLPDAVDGDDLLSDSRYLDLEAARAVGLAQQKLDEASAAITNLDDPWLEAVARAAQARHRAELAKWEEEEVGRELSFAELAATKYREGQWWASEQAQITNPITAGIDVNPKRILGALPIPVQVIFRKDEERLAEIALQMRELFRNVQETTQMMLNDSLHANERAISLRDEAEQVARRQCQDDADRAIREARMECSQIRAGAENDIPEYMRIKGELSRLLGDVAALAESANCPSKTIDPLFGFSVEMT